MGDRSLDLLLADYAAGALSPPLHALVAAHLELGTANRAFVRDLESVAAESALLGEGRPPGRREAMLEAIFAGAGAEVRPPPRSTALPKSIAAYMRRDIDDMKWKRLLPGVREYRVEDGDGVEASLLWIGAGRKVPVHTHDGEEVTLVLRGAFSDARGRYARGDIAIADGEIEHRPVADKGEDCLCFAVTDAPLRLTGPIGRIVQRFVG